MATNKKHELQVLLEYIDGVEVRSYSGRSMYGEECLAATNCDLGPLVAAMVEAAGDGTIEHVGEVVYALERMRTDSLGRDIIIYFPGVPFYNNASSSEDEDELED